jgi:hypothetical protein
MKRLSLMVSSVLAVAAFAFQDRPKTPLDVRVVDASRKADVGIAGRLTIHLDSLLAEVRFRDLVATKEAFAAEYRAPVDEIRRLAHRIGDDVLARAGDPGDRPDPDRLLEPARLRAEKDHRPHGLRRGAPETGRRGGFSSSRLSGRGRRLHPLRLLSAKRSVSDARPRRRRPHAAGPLRVRENGLPRRLVPRRFENRFLILEGWQPGDLRHGSRRRPYAAADRSSGDRRVPDLVSDGPRVRVHLGPKRLATDIRHGCGGSEPHPALASRIL